MTRVLWGAKSMAKNYLSDIKEVRVYSVGSHGNVVIADQNNRILHVHHSGRPEEQLVIEAGRVYRAKKVPTPKGYGDIGHGFFMRDLSTKRLRKNSRAIYYEAFGNKVESGNITEVVNDVVILSKREWEKFRTAYAERKTEYERKSDIIHAAYNAIVKPAQIAIDASRTILDYADSKLRKEYEQLGEKPDLEKMLAKMF